MQKKFCIPIRRPPKIGGRIRPNCSNVPKAGPGPHPTYFKLLDPQLTLADKEYPTVYRLCVRTQARRRFLHSLIAVAIMF